MKWALLALDRGRRVSRGRAGGRGDDGGCATSRSAAGPSRPWLPPIRFNMLGLHWQGTGTVDYRTRSTAGRWSPGRAPTPTRGPTPARPRRGRRLARREPRLDVGLGRRPVPRRAPSRGCAPTTSGPGSAAARCERCRSPARPRSSRAPTGRPTRRSSAPGRSYAPDAQARRRPPHRRLEHATPRPRRRRSCAGSRSTTCRQTAGTTSATTSSSTASARSTRAGGRDERNVIGAHAVGFNTGTVGVALIGNFARATPPPGDAGRARAAARVAARHRARRSALAGRRPARAATRVPSRQGRHAARDLGPPRHRPDRVPRRRHLRAPARRSRRVARTGLPKLYSPAVTARSAASPLPGPALLDAPVDGHRDERRRQGRRAAQRRPRRSSTGRGARPARPAGPFSWRSTGGPRPAARGGHARRPDGSSPDAVARDRFRPRPGSVPPEKAAPLVCRRVGVVPAVLNPAPDGSGSTLTAGFTLGARGVRDGPGA